MEPPKRQRTDVHVFFSNFQSHYIAVFWTNEKRRSRAFRKCSRKKNLTCGKKVMQPFVFVNSSCMCFEAALLENHTVDFRSDCSFGKPTISPFIWSKKQRCNVPGSWWKKHGKMVQVGSLQRAASSEATPSHSTPNPKSERQKSHEMGSWLLWWSSGLNSIAISSNLSQNWVHRSMNKSFLSLLALYKIRHDKTNVEFCALLMFCLGSEESKDSGRSWIEFA